MVVETALYELLGVESNATPSAIRKGYRKAALKAHPDRGGDTAEFQKLQEAYATLFDVEKRRIYDEFGAEGIEEWNSGVGGYSSKPSISKEDIEAFVRKYRFAPMESDDVKALFVRLKGKVAKVLQYIPYSDVKDLKRFIAMWDEEVEGSTPADSVTREYKKARKALLKRASKFKERTEGDFSLHEEDVEDSDGEDVGGNDEKDGGMGALIAQFAATREKRAADFDDMIAGMEEKYGPKKKAPKKATKAKSKKTMKASPSSSASGSSSRKTRSATKKENASEPKTMTTSTLTSGPRKGRVAKKRS